MESNLRVGKRLIIELENECYVGDVKYVSKNQNRIELENVSDFETNETLSGVQIFYKSDIKSIKLIRSNSGEETPHEDSDTSSVSTTDADRTETTHLTSFELEEIERICHSSQFIMKTDRFYHDSIREIKRHHEVVLLVEGSQVGRSTRTSIITIATRHKVYIFDILSLGRVYPELKEVLEASRPIKIIHDSRKVADNLKHQQVVELKGIFDTYAAHVGSGGDKSIWDLGDCIKKYLNMPTNFLVSNKHVNWQERPFDDNRKILTSKKAMFTFKIYDCILHDHILKNVYKQFELFSHVYSNNKDSVEVASDIASNKNSSADDIESIDLDLAMSFVDT